MTEAADEVEAARGSKRFNVICSLKMTAVDEVEAAVEAKRNSDYHVISLVT